MRKLLVLLFLALPTPAFAQTCIPVEVVVAQFQAHPMTADVYVASAAEAKLAVEIYNAMPPESEGKYNTVVMATAVNESGIVFVGNDNMVCEHMVLPAPQWRIFVRSVRGQDA
jgi:hypothetical protein